MSKRDRLFKYSNTLTELSKLLSDRLWQDGENIKDQFILCAFADGIHSAATELEALCEDLDLPKLDDEDLQPEKP